MMTSAKVVKMSVTTTSNSPSGQEDLTARSKHWLKESHLCVMSRNLCDLRFPRVACRSAESCLKERIKKKA